MTTNAIDRRKRILASDSRWSYRDKQRNLLFFVDNTGFDKISDRGIGAIICAGYGPLIEAWKNWFLAPIMNTAAMPATEMMVDGELMDVTISLWVKPNCTPLYIYGSFVLHGEDALFTGSGMRHAYECYTKNRCGKQAVLTAGLHDPATGGETKYVEFDTGRNNLTLLPTSLSETQRQLDQRGMVMDMQTEKVVPIQDFNAKGTELFSGMTLSAPTGQPARAWSEGEREELRKAFEKLAEMEAADKTAN